MFHHLDGYPRVVLACKSEPKQVIHISSLAEYNFDGLEFLEFQDKAESSLNIFHYHALSKMKIKNYNSFLKFALFLSGDIQLNPGPSSDICFVCKRALNKISFCCIECELTTHKKCNNTVFFDSDICSDCKRWEKLPFHNVSFCIDNSSNTESSLLEDYLPLILSHNQGWKVFKDKDMHFRHLNRNSLLSKIEELRTPAFNTNISVLGITETKLDNTVSNGELKIDGYNLLQSGRNKSGNGVACYIKNNIAHN